MELVQESLQLFEKYKEKAGNDCITAVKNSKKLPKEMKEKILPLIIGGNTNIGTSWYKNGVVYGLKGAPDSGSDLGADKDGFFVHTHRARSKSKPEIDKIPKKDLDFIRSTG